MFRILVELRRRRLLVLDGEGGTGVEYPVICGRRSHEGSKEIEGDEKTPRGHYYICTINKKSEFTLFFGISYPGAEDARRGLERGLIGEQQYGDIVDAISKGKRPPWNTPLGGEVGIHGGGIDRDGTRGCIGMRDEDVMSLKRYVFSGMPVDIVY